MNWFAWVLIIAWVVNPLLVITRIGERREPYTRGDAAVAVILSALLVVALLTIGTGSR